RFIRDLVADEADLVAEDAVLVAESGLRRGEAMQDGGDAGQRLGLLRGDRPHARTRVLAPEHARGERARRRDVLCVRRASGHALHAVDALPRLPDLLELHARGVRGEVAALDDRERLEDLAFEFVATLDDSQSGHYFVPRRAADIPAFTMFTYAPQRQRLPVTARRISSSF